MTSLKLDRLCAGLQGRWPGYLRDWDRSLRAANRAESTRYGYLLTAAQFGRFLAAERPVSAAVCDPIAVAKQQVEAFQVWMIETRSAATALSKHKALQQFFVWLSAEEELEHSPMERIPQPKTPSALIPVLGDEDTKKLLDRCEGKGFLRRRDEALIRMFYGTGARLSEVGNLLVTDVDLDADTVHLHGKGAKERRVRLGPKTAAAVSRYLRVRSKHRGSENLAELWLAFRGAKPLRPNGIKIRLKRLGEAAGVGRVYAHRWRHNFAHEWKLAGGDSGDLMLVLGWSSEEMARRYGASAAAERAQQTQARLRVGEHV